MSVLSIENRRLQVLSNPKLAESYPAFIATGRRIIQSSLKLLGICCERHDSKLPSDSATRFSITPMIKPVGDDCNLRCKYCTTHAEKPVGRRMSRELLSKIFEELLPRSSMLVDCIFHGGEPLLAGVDFYRTALKLQNEFARPAQVIQNHVQTNGTLINEEWAEFFAENGFFVGISLDGPQTVHDKNRIWPDGRGTHADIMRGLSILKRAGVKLHAIAVVPPSPLYSGQLLYRFINETGIRKWRINHCRSTASVDTYPDFMVELFDEWIRSPDTCEIGIFSEIIESALGYPVHTCWMKGSCMRFIGFDPDGSVTPCCELTVPEEFVYGNLMKNSLADLLESPNAVRFGQLFSDGRNWCNQCEWRSVCFGCAYMRIQAAGSPAGPDPLCTLYKGIFKKITNRIDEIIGSSEING